MGKVQGFEVMIEGLVSLGDVYQVAPMKPGVDSISNFMIPQKGKVFTSIGTDPSEFNKSWMSGDLRKLIEEGAIKPVDIESEDVNMPEFNSKNKVEEKDLSNMSIEELEKLLETKKKTVLIEKIQETQEENKEKDLEVKTKTTVVEQTLSNPLLKDFIKLVYQDKLTFISKTDDKEILKAIVSSVDENSVVKNRALDKLAK